MRVIRDRSVRSVNASNKTDGKCGNEARKNESNVMKTLGMKNVFSDRRSSSATLSEKIEKVKSVLSFPGFLFHHKFDLEN